MSLILEQIPLDGPFRLRLLDAQTSQSAGRVLLNDNFRMIQAAIEGLQDPMLSKLKDVAVPTPPRKGRAYVLEFQADSKYHLVDTDLGSAGTLVLISVTESVTVDSNRQYLVHGELQVLGDMTIYGEVVIF